MKGPTPTATDSDSPSRDEKARTVCPPTILDYELLRRIGSGSYGDVWLARNVVGQFRAVKIIYRGRFTDPRPFEREFEGIQRFEPISRSHPSQLHILHIGKNDSIGCFYYVMELADSVGTRSTASEEPVGTGSTPSDSSDRIRDVVKVIPTDADSEGVGTRSTSSDVSDQIRHGVESFPTAPLNYVPHTLRFDLEQRGRLPPTDCVQIGLSLATALAHLHEQGLVHRDIKPSNIIFVKGVAKLGDIGLVTDSGDTQSIVGTEGYLPPEGPGTPQADLYSLGKVLYEISTGMDRRRFAALPEDSWNWPDRDQLMEFNEIVLRACAKDPAQRYQTAEQLRADLALLQEGQSVRRERTHQRGRTVLLKLVAALGICAVLVVGGMAIRQLSQWTINPSDRLSKNPEANKEYLEGVHCARRDTAEGTSQGIAHFKRAIEIDPGFAMAYNGLYEIYVADPGPSSRACVDMMMELEPNLAEAHAGLGYLDFLDWKWEQAEPRFRKAIELNPRCAIAHMRYGFCLVHAGRPDEGYRELLTAEILNPTSPRIKKNIGHVFYLKRQFREAIAQYQKALDLEPTYPTSHTYMSYAYRALGDYTNAINEIERHDLIDGSFRPEARQRIKDLRRAYAENGPRGYWLKQIEQAKPTDKNYLYWQAQSYAHLNDFNPAFDLLKNYFEAKTNAESLEWLLFDECWDRVRDDPRFVTLLRLVGLRN